MEYGGKRVPVESKQKTLRIGLAVSVTGAMGFVILAAWVIVSGGTDPFDQGLSLWVQSWQRPWLDQIMIDLSYLCIWQVLVVGGVLASLWLLVWRRWQEMLLIWASLLVNSALISVLKLIVHRSRPDQASALLPAAGFSFPSGHTFSSVAFYGVIGLMLALGLPQAAGRRLAVAMAIAFSGLVGLSRVYVGAHWPTDVLGSWLLGLAWLGALAIPLSAMGHREPAASAQRARMGASAAAVVVIWAVILVTLAILDPGIRRAGAIGDQATASIATDLPGLGPSGLGALRTRVKPRAFPVLISLKQEMV